MCELVRTAVELQAALEKAPSELKPIGRCVTSSLEWSRNHDRRGDEDEDEDDEDDDDEQSGKQEDEDTHSDARGLDKTSQKVQRAVHSIADLLEKSGTRFATGQLNYWTWKELGFHFRVGALDEKCTLGALEDEAKSCNLLQRLYQEAPRATFGDNQKLETRVDSKVRSGADLTTAHFSVDREQELCAAVAEEWSSRFVPSSVTAKLHKLNMYRQGDHFSAHRDTPAKGLVGTLVLGLADTTTSSPRQGQDSSGDEEEDNDDRATKGKRETVASTKGRGLEVSDGQRWHRWKRASPLSWCAFYTDCPHRVCLVEDGVRATLTFKIFSDGDGDGTAANRPARSSARLAAAAAAALDSSKTAGAAPQYQTSKELDSAIGALLQAARAKARRAVGLLLSHSYSISTQDFKGTDAMLHQALAAKGVRMASFPVLVHDKGSWYGPDCGSGDGDEFESQVFALTDDHVNWLLGKGGAAGRKRPKNPDGCKDLDFYTLGTGHTLKSHGQSYIEHTGNESQPEEQDSLYVHRALVLFL